jgi:hypothetical protein
MCHPHRRLFAPVNTLLIAASICSHY